MDKSQTIQDQMGRSVQVPMHPQRIISLVPSQTELLHYLHLEDRVVGITKFCEFPEEWFRNKTRIGGTKQFHFDRISALKPDLLIGNKEENEQGQIEELALSYPVWMSDIKTLEDALEMIQSLGDLTGRSSEAQTLVQEIKISFDTLATKTSSQAPISAAYLIWKDPYMAAATDTFIDHLMTLAGFSNAFAQQSRYPVIALNELQEQKPDCILLSSEPYPFKEKHLAELQKLCPQSVIKLVDGTLFSWYGNRLLHSALYFLNLHTEVNNLRPQR